MDFNKYILLLALLLFCFIQVSQCADPDPPRIKGEISMFGKWMKTQKGKNIMAFLGIPYAQPPVDDLRFADPKPLEKLNENFNATLNSDFCPQIPRSNKTEISMSEDCLRLNVYTKDVTTVKPVLVYIHGGAFLFGGGQSNVYAPDYLLDNDIVLVSINYRLGPFGFLSTKTKDATGNYALKDQVLALKWVRDNIKHFGGDPNAVTIFGQSAGGWSVSCHLVSPMSKGLFHRAIAVSGSATFAYFIDNLKWTKLLAKNVDCTVDDTAEMVKCLRKVPWQKLAEGSIFKEELNTITNFNIEIEGDFGQERFLIEHPSLTVKNGKFHKVPIMTGTTKDEFDELAHVLANETGLEVVDKNFEELAPKLFSFEQNTKKSPEISKKLKEFYFKKEAVSKKNINKLSEIFSDSSIIHSVHRLVQLASKFVDVYFYRFDYKGRFTCGSKDEKDVPNFVGHSDDLQYLFVFPTCAPPFNETDREQFMVERINNWFYNFVKTGNPNDNKTIDANCETWPASNNASIKTLFNDVKCSVGDEPYQDRMKLWDELFPVESKGFRASTGYFSGLIGLSSLILYIVNRGN